MKVPHNILDNKDYLQLVGSSSISTGMQDFCKTGKINIDNPIVFVGYDKIMSTQLFPFESDLNDDLFSMSFNEVRQKLKPVSGKPYIFLVKRLREIATEYPDKKFVIVFGKTDRPWGLKHESYLPRNVTKVFACNVDFDSNRSHPLPLGRDFRLARETYRASDSSIADRYKAIDTTKSIQCYANFSVNTFPGERKVIAKACRLNETIDSGDMGSSFLNYNLPYDHFLEKLAASKFSICPRGNAIDSFRLWDSLYLGCIPIVTDDSLYRRMALEIPVISLSIEHISRVDFFALEKQYQFFWQDDYQQALATHLSCESWRKIMFA